VTTREFGEHVRLDVDAGIATLWLDRPPMNVLDVAMQESVRAAAQAAPADSTVAAVVVWGGDRTFAAGADVKEMASMSLADMTARSADLQSSLGAVAGIPKPVVAAVTGYALGGGCELAMCADFRVCASNAKLGQPEILLGIIPGAGGTQRLTRLVGASRAKDIIFTGRFVEAEEALAIGLVDRVVEPHEVLATATEWAKSFVKGPALALRAAKASIDRGVETDLTNALEIERNHFAALFATEDRERGMRSFAERGPGKAEFVGR